MHSSTDDNKVIPVGFPANNRFRVAGPGTAGTY